MSVDKDTQCEARCLLWRGTALYCVLTIFWMVAQPSYAQRVEFFRIDGEFHDLSIPLIPRAVTLSADGKWLVGGGLAAASAGHSQGFAWNEAIGMRPLAANNWSAGYAIANQATVIGSTASTPAIWEYNAASDAFDLVQTLATSTPEIPASLLATHISAAYWCRPRILTRYAGSKEPLSFSSMNRRIREPRRLPRLCRPTAIPLQ